jgi:hypothetical protein
VLMMFMVAALGIFGAVVFGVLGLRGTHNELEQIFAIACLAMTAAGIVGVWGERYDRIHHIATSPHA